MSILSANLLYLFCMLLLIGAGSYMQSLDSFWGLIATEVFIILLPVLVLIRAQKLNFRKVLRLRKPQSGILVAAVLMGAGAWAISPMLTMISTLLLGYSAPQVFSVPIEPGRQLLYFVAMSFAAPICEELLFRGYILRAYEQRGPRFAFWASGLLFAFFHLRLQGLLPILPVALLLGFIVLRSESIFTAMAAHFAFNTLSVVTSLMGLQGLQENPGGGTAILLCGLFPALILLGIGAFIYFRRNTRQPSAGIATPDHTNHNPWVAYLPLAVAGILFVFIVTLEFLPGRLPGVFARDVMPLKGDIWQNDTRLTYDVENISGTVVGSLDCDITTKKTTLWMSCLRQQNAYKVDINNSHYQSDSYSSQRLIEWQANDLNLETLQQTYKADHYQENISVLPVNGALELRVKTDQDPEAVLPVPADAFVLVELPWRLSGLEHEKMWPFGYRLTIAWPMRYDPASGKNHPMLQDATLQPEGVETIITPAGVFSTNKVVLTYRIVGGKMQESLWYDTSTRMLVKYHDGVDTYLLKQIETKSGDKQ